MKKILNILVLGALMACLIPAQAQNSQEWQSTSTMRTSGSAYTPQVTAVGAASVVNAATTTDTYSPAKAPSGPHKSIEYHGDQGGDPGSPLGDAVLPMLAFALMFCGYVAVRRKRAVNG